jgi:hypothetical protein
LTWSKPAGTGAIFLLLRHFSWRDSQKMALNMAKTTGNPYGTPSHPGTDMDSHYRRNS